MVNFHPMLEWLSTMADQLPRINIGGEEMGGREAVQAGLSAVRQTFQCMGILSREDLSEWIHSHNHDGAHTSVGEFMRGS